MVKKRWQDLSHPAQTAIVISAAVDATLKAFAMKDLWKRPAAEVRGPKVLWGLLLALSNSAGVVPLIYLLYGRSKASEISS